MSKNVSNSLQLRGKVVFFATGNVNKFNEARRIFSSYGIAVGMLKLKGDEIQSESLIEIAEKSVQYAYEKSGLPIFVEDAGLFIDSLNGFPGPYAAYIYKTIHNSGVLKLMADMQDKSATFRSVISFCDEKTGGKPMSFLGESKGEITVAEHKVHGKTGFGFDPIFQPSGCDRTFAEMSLEEKNEYSHRAEAIRKFALWFKTH